MDENQAIKPGQVLSGALFNEPMRVETVRANGLDTWTVGLVGVRSERFGGVGQVVEKRSSVHSAAKQ